MPRTPDLYRSSVCRALLQAAKLSHLWTATGIKRGSRRLLAKLHLQNPRDAEFLQVVLALCNEDFEGPSLQTILKQEPVDRAALLLAPLAAHDARQCQLWLAFFGAHYEFDGGE